METLPNINVTVTAPRTVIATGQAEYDPNKPYIQGWYYDFQKDPERSPLTTVSLHCNRVYTGTGDTGIHVRCNHRI